MVAALADVLEVSAEPDDPTRPQGTLDATHKPRSKATRPPRPAQPGRPPRDADADERNGTRHLWLCLAPQAGRRPGQVTAPRTKLALAYARQWLVDAGSPEATVMRVVLDQRQTLKSASRYDAFEPAEARRIAKQLALHAPPQQGSGLHRAESALRVLQHPWLERRIPDAATLTRELAAWAHQRNTEQATIVWRFAGSDARHKLTRLSPSLPS